MLLLDQLLVGSSGVGRSSLMPCDRAEIQGSQDYGEVGGGGGWVGICHEGCTPWWEQIGQFSLGWVLRHGRCGREAV